MIRTCQSCGNSFDAIPAEVARGRAKWCSRQCYFDRKKTSIEHRFFKKVHKTNGCWLWIGAMYPQGYGCIGTTGLGRSIMPAHRVSWLLHFGEIPEGLNVLHKCDVRACVNPAHLFLGTIQDNVDDMIAKGRHNLNGNAKVTEDQVAEIRMLYDSGRMTKTQIARRYGRGVTTIIKIVNRETWKQVQ